MHHVSILARSGDRALPGFKPTGDVHFVFQSSPGLVTGRYFAPRRGVAPRIVFQSSPGLVTGRYYSAALLSRQRKSFNPRPVW